MKFFAGIFAISLLLLGLSTARSEPAMSSEASELVKKLGDPDPNLRGQAYEKLAAMKDNARAALQVGAESSQPQIAESCQALIARLPWFRENDPPEAIQILRGYAAAPEHERAQKIRSLITHPDEQTRQVGLRMIDVEPSDSIKWDSIEGISYDDTLQKLIKSRNIDSLKPQLLYALARTYRVRDRREWLRLLNLFLQRELDHPTAPAHAILNSVENINARTKISKEKGALIPYYRHAISLIQTDESAEPYVNKLFAIHARYGPFPGFAEDIKRFGSQSKHHMLALAHLASRSGAKLPAAIFRENLIDEENQPENMDELQDIAQFAILLGDSELAKVGLFKLAEMDQDRDPDHRIAIDANLRLFFILVTQSSFQQAANRLETAVSLSGDAKMLRIPTSEGLSRPLEIDKVDELVKSLYFKQAVADEDPQAAKKIALEMAHSQFQDESIFMDIIDDLEKHLSRADFVVYAERVYQSLKPRWQAMKDDPQANNEFAWLCARANIHLDEALPASEFAVQNAPNIPAFIDTLAEVHFRLGNPNKAIELELQALKIVPNDEVEFMEEQLERFRAAAATQPAK